MHSDSNPGLLQQGLRKVRKLASDILEFLLPTPSPNPIQTCLGRLNPDQPILLTLSSSKDIRKATALLKALQPLCPDCYAATITPRELGESGLPLSLEDMPCLAMFGQRAGLLQEINRCSPLPSHAEAKAWANLHYARLKDSFSQSEESS
jgi:hypothetical protein